MSKSIQGTVISTLETLKKYGVTFRKHEYNGKLEYQFRYVPAREIDNLMKRFAKAYGMTPARVYSDTILTNYGHMMLVIRPDLIDRQLKRAEQWAERYNKEHNGNKSKWNFPTFHQLVNVASEYLPSQRKDNARLENMKDYHAQCLHEEKHDDPANQVESSAQQVTVEPEKPAHVIANNNLSEQEAIAVMNKQYHEQQKQSTYTTISTIPMSGFENYKLTELREFCKRLGIKVSGKKQEVVQRLYDASGQ